MAEQSQLKIGAPLSLDPGVRTPIYPPIACDNAAITNAGADLLYLWDASMGGPISIPPQTTQSLAASNRRTRQRFHSDDCAFYLQPASGVGPVIIVFT